MSKGIGKVLLKAVFFVIFISLLIELGLNCIPGAGSNDGWLGYWGGIVGAIVAIYGVYWQVNNQAIQSKKDADAQTDLLSKQLTNEKENQYRQARPFFLLSQQSVTAGLSANGHEMYTDKSGNDIYLERFSVVPGNLIINSNTKINYLEINNVSNKDMYAVKVLFSENLDDTFMSDFHEFVSLNDMKESQKKFYDNGMSIAKIKANQKCDFVIGPVKAKRVWVWYITELRESVKLFFEDDGIGLTYKSENKLLENQQVVEEGKNNSAVYELSDFKNSKLLSDVRISDD